VSARHILHTYIYLYHTYCSTYIAHPHKYHSTTNHPPSLTEQLAQAPDKDTKKLFKNLEFSGKGGFGRVFGGKDIATRHRVAIKKLPHVTDKDKRNNYSEIAFLMTCEHPNIVKFLSAYEVKEEVWIVMEFLEGGTLNEAVKVHQFSEKHIAYVAREMLKGLKYLHAQGFVHRDLKSANVMMSIDGDIKLIDFGLCADVSEGERVQMLGSPFWMPPEMIHRKPHGCAVSLSRHKYYLSLSVCVCATLVLTRIIICS
jgi:serine/threonine protein kinase